MDVGTAGKFISDAFIGGCFVADECDDGVAWVAGQDGNERPLYRSDLDCERTEDTYSDAARGSCDCVRRHGVAVAVEPSCCLVDADEDGET